MIRHENGIKEQKQLEANAPWDHEKAVVKAGKKARWDKPIIKQCDFNGLITKFLELGAKDITKKPSESMLLNKAMAALEKGVEKLASS